MQRHQRHSAAGLVQVVQVGHQRHVLQEPGQVAVGVQALVFGNRALELFDVLDACALWCKQAMIDGNVRFAHNVKAVPCQQVVNVVDRTGRGVFQRQHAEVGIFLRYRLKDVLKSGKKHRLGVLAEKLLGSKVGIGPDRSLTGNLGAFDDLARCHEFLAQLAVVSVEKHLLVGGTDVDQRRHQRPRAAAELSPFKLHTL